MKTYEENQIMEEVKIITGNPVFDEFYPRIKTVLLNDGRAFFINDKIVKGYTPSDGPNTIWLRDHTHSMKGSKYFENEMKSLVNYFLDKQLPDGSFYDYIVKGSPGAIRHFRIDNEADVEYHMVDAVHQVWQSTGDDEWMNACLQQAEKGLNYSLSDPKRWSQEYGLVKRPFTIDTWDFEYLPGQKPKAVPRTIDERTRFCVMHGDNSGVYQACRLLAKMFGYTGNGDKAQYWNEKAEQIKTNTNNVCWNGTFYTHQIHIDPVEAPELDERQQLSLSNPYDINRGIASHAQAVNIINEYRRRRKTVDSFAEWFSIDPPFPFNFEGERSGPWWSTNAGNYVNGGIMPLVGGELARACFEHGFEDYGVDILSRYHLLLSKNGNDAYLWYFRDGKPGISCPATQPYDGWGASAMLNAFIEGLAGVKDESKCLQNVGFSPRWAAADVKNAKVKIGYAISGKYFGYNYSMDDRSILITLEGSTEEISCHVLLPKGTEAKEVLAGKNRVKFASRKIEQSRYVDFRSNNSAKEITIKFEPFE